MKVLLTISIVSWILIGFSPTYAQSRTQEAAPTKAEENCERVLTPRRANVNDEPKDVYTEICKQ